MVCVWMTEVTRDTSRAQNTFLQLPRPRRPRAIKISHLALKRLDVVGIGVTLNKWSDVIVIRKDPVACVYFIRHVIRVTIEPILAVHEIHAFGFGVPHTLRARPRRRASGRYALDLIFVNGIT